MKIKSLSFCIPACGMRETLLRRAINSIHYQDIDIPYEINVYGMTRLIDQPGKDLRVQSVDPINFKINEEDPKHCRINAMFNRLAEMSKGDFLVYMGDDQELIYRWWEAAKQLDMNDFDLTVFPCFQFEKGKEPVEWYSWNTNKNGIHHKHWNERTDEFTYISSGCLIIRREIVLKMKWDEKTHRGGDFNSCQRCFKSGYRLRAYDFMRRAYSIHYLAEAPYRISEKIKE